MTKKKSEQKRIKQLEELIPFMKSNLSHANPHDWYYPQMKLKLDEYLLEYKERTGREYNLRFLDEQNHFPIQLRHER